MFLIFLFLLIITLTYLQKTGSSDTTWRKVEENIYFEPLYNRELLPTAPMEKFFRVHFREVLILKLGQRKLLFNELEFYNICKQRTTKNITVVYAGSAPGIHYYDANPFCEELKKYSNMHLYNQYFEDKDAKYWFNAVSRGTKERYEKNYLIFLSDVRRAEDEGTVEQDMIMQQQWVEIMKPDACMLKFRLRWRPAGTMEYFDGKIYFQPRISFSSTETRLIFFPQNDGTYKIKLWDNEQYNNQIFYYQRHHRNAFHEYNFFSDTSFSDSFSGNPEKTEKTDEFNILSKEIKGLCHCHDCWSEIAICKEFLKSNQIHEVIALVLRIEKHTKSTLNTAPHNMLVNERDINKKIRLLEKIAFQNVDNIVKKITDQNKPRKTF